MNQQSEDVNAINKMHPILKQNLDRISKYCQENNVEKLHAFGSVMTDTFTGDSDLDFLVKFKDIPHESYADSYFRLHALFEALFQRKIDLVTEKSLGNPYFIKKVNPTKMLLYDENQDI